MRVCVRRDSSCSLPLPERRPPGLGTPWNWAQGNCCSRECSSLSQLALKPTHRPATENDRAQLHLCVCLLFRGTALAVSGYCTCCFGVLHLCVCLLFWGTPLVVLESVYLSVCLSLTLSVCLSLSKLLTYIALSLSPPSLSAIPPPPPTPMSYNLKRVFGDLWRNQLRQWLEE